MKTERRQSWAAVLPLVFCICGYADALPPPIPPLPDMTTTHMNNSVSGNVLGNDSLPDGGNLTAVLTSEPSNGELTEFDWETGDYTYQPEEGFVGTDTFTYIATDGELYTDPITVTITVTNALPVAGDDAATTNQDVAVVIDVLANDIDPDGDPLTAALVGSPAHGTLTPNPDGTFTYTPGPGYAGQDGFTYYATDGQAGAEFTQTTVSITVNPSEVISVFIDIKPQSCPDPLNVKDKGVLSVAILGLEDFDVLTIDTASIRLEGVAPVRSSYEDVATPMPDGAGGCECTTAGPDGYLDLVLKFNAKDIVGTLGQVNDGDVLELALTGALVEAFGETPIEGTDCVVIVAKPASGFEHVQADGLRLNTSVSSGQTLDIDGVVADDYVVVYGTLNLHPGAEVVWVYAFGGEVNIYGGQIDGFVMILSSEPNPIVTIYGVDFAMNGIPLVDENGTPLSEFMLPSYTFGILTGTYENGDPIDLGFYVHGNVPIYLATSVHEVPIHIKPGSCPNPLNVKDKGLLSVAILGLEDFDVLTIDTASIRLEGVAPVRSSYEDVATPMPDGAEVCECTTEGLDGHLDLVLKFNVQDIVAALGIVNDSDVLQLTLSGVLADAFGETPIEGTDCIVIIAKGGK